MAAERSRDSNVQDDYVLLEQIGQRAGKVFRAQHVREQRTVVVRIWRAPDKASRDRFVALAKLARGVRHPVLPAIEAFGYHGDNACYVVSECARGESLDRWADRMGIPSVPTAIELFQRVCVGLNAAHRNGLTHDALNPRNLWVTESDSDPLLLLEPCVLDLGVPAFVRAFPPSLRAARFMAPEQLARALNERALPAADVRMNVYSCGSLLHYLCTGGAPFLGRTLEEFAHAQAAGQPVPPSRINPQVPPALDAVILRALAHDPSERYASMAEFGHALERVRTGTGTSGVRPIVAAGSLSAFEPGRFDERPTSEAPRLPLSRPTPMRPTPMRPPPASPIPADEAQRRAPAGLFSSAPPAPSAAPREDSQRSARSSVGTERTSRAQAAEATMLLVRARAEQIGAALARAWKRLHPEAKRWLVASVTASAAIVLALRLAQLTMKPPQAVEPGQRVQPASAAQRDVGVPAPAAPARVPVAASPSAGVVVAVPVTAPVTVPAAARVPVTATAPVAVPALPALLPATPAAAKLRGRGFPTLARDATTARGPTQASTQLSVQAREPALEVKPVEPAAPLEPLSPAVAADVPNREPSAPAATIVSAHPAPLPVATPDKPATQPRAVVPLAARVRTSDLVVHGSVATSVVRRAIERMSTQLAACYARSAVSAGRNAFGASQVDIEIDEHGRARDAHARGSALPGLDACVAGAARGLVADRPPDTGRVQASFKVAFTP